MMKKLIYTSFVVLCSLFFSHMALANDAGKANYISMQKPAGESITAPANYSYEISIINYSSRYIDIYVPSLAFSATLFPYYVQYVYSNNNDPKRVILYDYRGIAFYDELVWNHQKVEVYDRSGKFEVKVN